MTTAEQTKLREALEAVDSEVVLTGHLKELVDEALAADAASPSPSVTEPTARAMLPTIRCDQCDNGIDDACWYFCPWCGATVIRG